jgi:hypothetical protein
MNRKNGLAVLPNLPLLITESAEEFDALRHAFEQEIKPRGIIERMYVHDICAIVWEILRLRRSSSIPLSAARCRSFWCRF